jgi:hypothetical protein
LLFETLGEDAVAKGFKSGFASCLLCHRCIFSLLRKVIDGDWDCSQAGVFLAITFVEC